MSESAQGGGSDSRVILGTWESVADPDRELLVLTLTCLSKAMDARPDSMPLVRELLSIIKRLNNPQIRLQTDFTPPTSEKD